jgi:hypothetical protein
MSTADQELSKHTFEGDAFLRGRSAFKEEFKEGATGTSTSRGPSSRDQVCEADIKDFLLKQFF